MLRLRGGQEGRALPRKEITAKLNQVPTFFIVDDKGNAVPLPSEDGEPEIVFFIDVAEANTALALLSAGNPEAELRLAVLALGAAFEEARGWPGEESPTLSASRVVLRGPSEAVEGRGEEVRRQLRQMGLADLADGWVLPVVCSDDFQTSQMMPLFFSEAELKAGWTRSGKPEAEAELLLTTAMDLRALVVNMANTDAMPWSRFQLVTSVEAYQLAQKLHAV